MKIAFYAPFKPLGHPHPSGDLAIGTGLAGFLQSRGHELVSVSDFRTRWIYKKPGLWAKGLAEYYAAANRLQVSLPDIFLTYHTYYKAPDLFGPGLARRLGIPYAIFQGIYSTKQKRKLNTLPGFLLNKKCLEVADFVFTNKKTDHKNLQRIIDPNRLLYIKPGIIPDQFVHDGKQREMVRAKWGVDSKTFVILSAAMFRPGVKTKSLKSAVLACRIAREQGMDFVLVIAGDGENRSVLTRFATERLGTRVIFVGKIPREKLARIYSGADMFLFPGIGESLGMVYLEAQSAGLPVVAYDGWGVPEVVMDRYTGFLAPKGDLPGLAHGVTTLAGNKGLRSAMAKNARQFVRDNHDLTRNYGAVETCLHNLIHKGPHIVPVGM